MSSATTVTPSFTYSVEIDDDGYQVYFFDGLFQVAGAFVPGLSSDSFALANRIGAGFGSIVTVTPYAH